MVATAAAPVRTDAQAEEIDSLCAEIIVRYEEVSLLHRMAGELSGLFDPQEICRRVLEEATDITHAGSACITLREDSAPGHAVAVERGRQAFELARRHGALSPDRPVVVDGQAGGRDALLSVPMTTGRGIPGTIVLAGREGGPFESGDLKLVGALASLAGVFIENGRLARRMQENERARRELEIARQIQQSLLPKQDPSIGGLDVAGALRTATAAGGDYYGYFPMSRGRMGIVIADVSGHDLAAALGMVITRSVMRVITSRGTAPGRVVSRANRLLCEDLGTPGLFVTLFYAILDGRTGELRYCNGGHHPPLFRRASTGTFEGLPDGGPGLGIVEEADYPERSARLETGDVLVLYTDGVLEAQAPDGSRYGASRLEALVSEYAGTTSREIRDRILESVEEFTGSSKFEDDLTVAVVRKKGENS